MSLRTDRSGPPPARAAAPLHIERCQYAGLLAFGLALVLVMGGVPAAALWGAAPEAAHAMAAWSAVAAGAWGLIVWAERRRWCLTTVHVTDEALEVRRPALAPERAGLREIRRMAWSAAGLTVWTAAGRALWLGRLPHAQAMRLAARLETASGVPVEGWEAPAD